MQNCGGCRIGQFPGLDTDNQKEEVSESERDRQDKTREGQRRTKSTALTQSRLK